MNLYKDQVIWVGVQASDQWLNISKLFRASASSSRYKGGELRHFQEATKTMDVPTLPDTGETQDN